MAAPAPHVQAVLAHLDLHFVHVQAYNIFLNAVERSLLLRHGPHVLHNRLDAIPFHHAPTLYYKTFEVLREMQLLAVTGQAGGEGDVRTWADLCISVRGILVHKQYILPDDQDSFFAIAERMAQLRMDVAQGRVAFMQQMGQGVANNFITLIAHVIHVANTGAPV